MRVIEKLLWVMFVFSMIWGMNNERLYITLLFFGILLALFYLFGSVILLNGIKGLQVFKRAAYTNLNSNRVLTSILQGGAYAITIIAVIFRSLVWVGGSFVVFFSFFAMMVTTIFVVNKLKKSDETSKQFYIRTLRRNVVLLAIATTYMVLHFLPREVEKSLFHSNYRGQSERVK